MNAIIDAALSRTRTVLAILFISVIFGVYSYINIPKEASPDIPFPFILISMSHPGISPTDAERLLIKPMEKRLQTIEGVIEMKASAVEGMAFISLEFDVNFDQGQALLDVREEVDLAKTDLPSDTEEPVVKEVSSGLLPVIAVTLSGEVPERKLLQLAKLTQDRIEALPGVLEVNLMGTREDLLEVVIDPVKLETYNITQQELFIAVTNNNRLIAAGALDTGQGRFSVKVPGLIESAQDVYDLPLKVSGDGVVTLSDVASIRRSYKDREGYALFNGQPAVALQVVKRIGANIIETNQSVRDTVAAAQKVWPDNIEVGFILDTSDFIKNAISYLQASILTAVALVMVIIVAALGLRSGLMVGIAIPSSFLLGLLFLNISGTSINNMVMFGLVLSVGMLVDGAIVVVEYADRKISSGLDKKEAYGLAAKRMSWPIITSTLTTLAAFLPMMLWPGLPGKFMSYLPLTLIYVLMASLIVALIFLPVIGSLIGQAQTGTSTTMRALDGDEHAELSAMTGFVGRYAKVIQWTIKQPVKVLGYASLIVTVIFGLSTIFKPGVMFFTNSDPEMISILVGARGNLSTDEARDLVTQVERRIANIEGIENFYTSTSSSNSMLFALESPPPDDTIGQINIDLKDWKERRHSKIIINEIRERTLDLPGIRVELRIQENGPPVGKDVQLELRSDFNGPLLAEASRIRNHFENVDGLIEVEDSRPPPGIDWELQVDREQAGLFGADVAQVGAVVQLVTTGVLIGEYRPDDVDDEVEIRVRYPHSERNLSQLDKLRIQTAQGLVPISNFVTRSPQPRVNKIGRLDGKRIISIRANTAPGILPSEKVAEVQAWLKESTLDPNIDYQFRGASEETEAATKFLSTAMLLSLFLMGIILLTQFNNFYHVILTLSSVVVSTVGVLLGIILTGQIFSVIMTGTGVVALAGIVVNNNIVLIDTFQRLREAGHELHDAVIRTATQRLRPVLLTTVTTVCGLLPMAFQLNVNFFTREVLSGGPVAIWWVELATAVVFGLAFATLITLILTPALLVLPHHLRSRMPHYRAAILEFMRKLWAFMYHQWNKYSDKQADKSHSSSQPAE